MLTRGQLKEEEEEEEKMFNVYAGGLRPQHK